MKLSLTAASVPDLCPLVNRAPGLHVSDVIRDIALRTGILKHQLSTDSDFAAMSRLQLGLALEHAIAARYAQDQPQRYCHLGELCSGGLFFTPDLFDTCCPGPDEIKLTWKSSRAWPAELGDVDVSQLESAVMQAVIEQYVGDRCECNEQSYWMYLAQTKFYTHALGCDNAHLHVCHVMGAYRDFRVDYRKWHLEFDKHELVENYNLIVNHAQRMLAEGWTESED